MATQIELAYSLKKHPENLFDTYLLVQVPVLGNQEKIEFLDQPDMEAAADGPNVVMGVRIQQEPGQQTLQFKRLPQPGNLEFPDNTEPDLSFEKLEFRIRTTFMDDTGQERDFAISYDIKKKNYEVLQGNILLGNQWLALVTFANGNFTLLHVRQEITTGGGNPCQELGCDEDGKSLATIVNCILSGCG